MILTRLLLLTLCSASGLVLLTQAPAAACSCDAASTAEQVERADAVFLGTLTAIDETAPADDGTTGSDDPVLYTFHVDRTFTGDAGDGVVESVRDGESCGLEWMRIDRSYVVFADRHQDGGLGAYLCGGTTRATPTLIQQVETALAPPGMPVPTEVPSGVVPDRGDDAGPVWAWLGGGMLLALLGGTALRRLLVR